PCHIVHPLYAPYCKCLMAESSAMTLRWFGRAVVLIGLFVPLTGYGDAQARRANDLAALRSQVSQLYGQGKYAEAIPIAGRYVELARRTHGENHKDFATAIEWLANLYRAQGRTTEAEPLLKRSLVIREKVLGPNHPDIGESLNDLGAVYLAQGNYAT